MADAAQASFTPSEAAALTGVGVKVVRKEIEKRVIQPRRVRRQARRQVALELKDLVYLRVFAGLDVELPARVRTRIHEVIARDWQLGEPQRELVVSGSLTIKVEEPASAVLSLLDRFVAWRERLVHDSKVLGGAVVFPGSRLSVRHVGGMLERGESPAVVKEDYPFLTEEDLEMARLYVRAYPHVGRPKTRQAAAR